MAAFFSHLECSVPCGAGPFDPRLCHQQCRCGAPLLARYDLTAARRWPRTSLEGREASLWRYQELLPLLEGERGLDQPMSLGEGWTPLLRARRLGRALGLERLYIKDEARNPGGSVAARGMATAVTRAAHLGLRVVTMAAEASAGPALAAYAARASLDARVFFTQDSRRAFPAACELAGAAVTRVEGPSADAIAHAAARAAEPGWYHVSAFREPYRLEGEKTIAFEIAEQLGWQLPDWVCCPVADGTTLVALWKGFAELGALGWTDPLRRPHLIGVQAAGCAPIVRAFAAGADRASAWDRPQTMADDLRVSETPGDVLVLRAIREQGGLAAATGDAEMIAGMKDCARNEGVDASPATGAAVHALRVLAAEGRLKPNDTVVLVNAGTALPFLDVLGPRAE